MNLSSRIRAFQLLGEELKSLPDSEVLELATNARNENGWFTSENIERAIKGISSFLSEAELKRWTSDYQLDVENAKTVGVAMAGNIPLVGFHDALCVLISGNHLKAKPSSQDSFLMKYLLRRLSIIEPQFDALISWEERLNGTDAMIATGGNNTARYFEYYFRSIPHIIRKNRSSCAILTGDESVAELEALAEDVFSYFGLGCRNISKVYLPREYDFTPVLTQWEKYTSVIHHHKYANNYDYQKAIMLINKIPFYDNSVILMKEDTALVSPISVLFYEYYDSSKDLTEKINSHKEKLQCVVSAKGTFPGSIPFGTAQYPAVSDYADGIDTLRFLEQLN